MNDWIDALLKAAPHLEEGAKRAPGHLMIRCPYHAGGMERTASCSVSAWKPVWWCHGCKASGHVSQLLRHFGLSKVAVDIVVPRNGDYARSDTIETRILRGKDPFRGPYVLNEELLDAYRTMPCSLREQGFAAKTLRHFEVGYDEDTFRITYPLRTVFGDLVGISGRTIYEGLKPRYKIYDTELIKRTGFGVPADYSMEQVKSAVLWHAHVVRPLFFLHNSGKESIVITEGFKACMWAWQAGAEDTVALVGSYLTPTHAELIARATRKVVLFLDNNEAGYRGTSFAARALTKKGVEVSVAEYPDEREQPDDLSPDEVLTAIYAPTKLHNWLSDHREPEPLKRVLKRWKFNETSQGYTT